MPTTPWTDFDFGADFYIGAAITFEMMRGLAQNPSAIAEGADGATRVSRRAIAPGGSEIDGAFDDGVAAPTAPGYYELESISLTINKTFPYVSIIRVNGDVTLSAILSVDTCDSTTEQGYAEALGCKIGNGGNPQLSASKGGSGGAALGSGGNGSDVSPAVGATGLGTGTLNRRWLGWKMIGGLGGANGDGGGRAGGGGVLVLIIQGDLVMTGGTLRANGQTGFGSAAGGGGAGGTLIVICTGTVTDGTFEAKGGAGGSDNDGTNSGGGGGGGGYVAVIASEFLGSQNISAAGGSGGVGGTNGIAGTAGVTEVDELTEAEINGILLR